MPWQQLQHALVVLQQVTIHNGGQLSSFEAELPRVLATAARPLPPATHIHLPWAISHLMDDTGYIPAAGQEALLHTFLGERSAATAAVLAL